MEVRNYVRRKKQKWYNVVLFDKEPRENPSKAKADTDIARFNNFSDAWLYAEDLASRPGWMPNLWGIVVR